MISYHVCLDLEQNPSSVIVAFDGENHPIAKGDYRFDSVIEAIMNGEEDKLPALVKAENFFSDDKGLSFSDNMVHIDGEAIPEELANRVIAFKKAGLPYVHLLAFARKIKENVRYNSRHMLFKFLEHNGHPITKEGNFIAYRSVRDNFTDHHTGRFNNSPGAVCEVPVASVDDNPNNTCSSGLHVACWSYAANFCSGNNRMIEVEVDPRDVVCVPTDYEGTKMRVSKFTVLSECERPRNDDEQLYGYDEDECDEFDDDENALWTLNLRD